MNPQEQAARKLDAEFDQTDMRNSDGAKYWRQKAIALESQLSQARSECELHLREVKKLQGIVTDGDIENQQMELALSQAQAELKLCQASNWGESPTGRCG